MHDFHHRIPYPFVQMSAKEEEERTGGGAEVPPDDAAKITPGKRIQSNACIMERDQGRLGAWDADSACGMVS